MDESNPLISVLLVAVAVGSAAFAAMAAAANYLQAKRAAQANEVSVFLEMQRDYGSVEMRAAVSELAKFWRECKDQPIEDAFRAFSASGSERSSQLRGHSRMLSAYFTNVARLYEAGLISRRLAKLLISHPGLNVFYDVAVPINRSKNPHHNSIAYCAILKQILPKHGAGTY